MLSDSHGGVSRAAEGLQWGRELCLKSHRRGAWAELGEKWERGGSVREVTQGNVWGRSEACRFCPILSGLLETGIMMSM